MWSNIPYYDLIARERNSMHIVQVINRVVPAVKYGGTERVVWWLSKKLAELGHLVFLANAAWKVKNVRDAIHIARKAARN
jgi:hypothetical protein